MSRFSTGKIALLVALGTESVFFITLLVAYAAYLKYSVDSVPILIVLVCLVDGL